MTLAALIRKRESGKVATAIPAIPATQPREETGTVAKIAALAVASPAAAKPIPLTADERTAIQAWLEHIEEADPEIITEVMNKCQQEREARDYFLRRAAEVPRPEPILSPIYCRDCANFERTAHPKLGHCAKGEPEAVAGLWDTDRRHCGQYRAIERAEE